MSLHNFISLKSYSSFLYTTARGHYKILFLAAKGQLTIARDILLTINSAEAVICSLISFLALCWSSGSLVPKKRPLRPCPAPIVCCCGLSP